MDDNKIVLDGSGRQVDRSTALGKAFDKMQEISDNEKNEGKKVFMNKVLAYTEAGMVIDNSQMDPHKKEEMLSQLRATLS